MIDFDMKSVSGRKGKQEGGIKKIERRNFFTNRLFYRKEKRSPAKIAPKRGPKTGMAA
jgi:hypothetical protein